MRFDDDIFDFANFGKGQAPAEPEAAMASDEGADAADRAEAKRAHRRTKECTELSQRYEYRRAFCGKSSERIDLSKSVRQDCIEPIHLLILQGL